MNLLAIGNSRHQFASIRTSGDGTLQEARDWVIHIGGALSVQGTTATESQTLWWGEMAAAEQTNSGLAAIDDTRQPSGAIAELRRRSGLTWDQIACLFHVARRSVHFWVSGKPMNAANEERLSRLLGIVRHIDRGSPRDTRAAIMNVLPDGAIPFDLLVSNEFDEVKMRLGAGQENAATALIPLSPSAHAARIPQPPEEHADALQDTVHYEETRSRAARSARTKGKQ